MRRTLLLFITAICIAACFTSCSKDEEETEATLYISLKDQNGKNLDGYIYFYPNGVYDPKKFDSDTFSIENANGEKTLFVNVFSPELSENLVIEQGTYYVIYHYFGVQTKWGSYYPSLIDVWKGETITVKGGEEKHFDFVLDTSKNGCQN